MRVAAILGPRSSTKDLKPFEKNSHANWLIGLPASASEAGAILIFGGDGTIHRHLAQLVKLQLPVLVVPCGSGNDFARALNLHSLRGSLAAWRKFSSVGGNVRTIDLGMITPLAPLPQGLNPPRGGAGGRAEPGHLPVSGNHKLETESPKYFCCVGGVGLDGEIARQANELPRWLRGHGGYVLSLAPALFRFAPVPMKILVPDSERSGVFVEHSTKLTVLAAFANAPSYGGGMRIAPRARLDDGRLDICIVSDLDKFRILCLFPSVYFGRHLSIPEVKYFRADRLRVETEAPLEVYADGEYVCRTPIEVSVARDSLRVVTP